MSGALWFLAGVVVVLLAVVLFGVWASKNLRWF